MLYDSFPPVRNLLLETPERINVNALLPPRTSSSTPNKISAHAQPSPQSTSQPHAASPTLVNRPLRHRSLRPHALHDLLHIRLNHHPSHNHLAQRRMQRLKVENQIQLADILKQPVQRFDVYLNQIDEGERGLSGGRNDDEIEGGVVTVRNEGGDVVVWFRRGGGGAGGGEEGREGKEVAGALWTVGDEGEDFGDESLLD